MRSGTRSVNEERRREKEGGEENERREKTFDKKKYRLQKYSNKYKVKQWEERRKKAAMREFYKELKRDQRKSAQTIPSLGDTSKSTEEAASTSTWKGYAFYRAKKEHEHKQEREKKRREEIAQAKAEREEALRRYKEKKMRTFKALSKRTRKGQPVMKDRLEMLLEKIQKDPSLRPSA